MERTGGVLCNAESIGERAEADSPEVYGAEIRDRQLQVGFPPRAATHCARRRALQLVVAVVVRAEGIPHPEDKAILGRISTRGERTGNIHDAQPELIDQVHSAQTPEVREYPADRLLHRRIVPLDQRDEVDVEGILPQGETSTR